MKKFKVERKVADEYIERYYKKKFENIDLRAQPNFWEAVGLMCEVGIDNADVSNLIIPEENWIFRDGNSQSHVSVFFKGAQNTTDVVKIIAKEILESESNEYTKMDIFILKKDIEEIKEVIDCLRVRRECY